MKIVQVHLIIWTTLVMTLECGSVSPIRDSRSVDAVLSMSDALIHQLEFQVTELLRLG